MERAVTVFLFVLQYTLGLTHKHAELAKFKFYGMVKEIKMPHLRKYKVVINQHLSR